MTKAIFTAAMLRDAHACQPQVNLFIATFGGRVQVTAARARKVASLFDWNYARVFLDKPALAEYYDACDATLVDNGKVCGAALAKYDKVCDAALAEYDKARDAAWAKYCKARDDARAKYDVVHDAERTKYDVVRAVAWACGYIATSNRKGN